MIPLLIALLLGPTPTPPTPTNVAIQPLTCSGTDKVSGVSSLGVVTCSVDQSGGSVPSACAAGEAVTSNGTALLCSSAITASNLVCGGTCVADAEISAVATTKLTGTVTDAQLASNYSGVGTCTNQFARALNDNAAPTCSTVVLGTDTTGSYYDTIQEDGATLTKRAALNFIGAGVTCVDNASKTECTFTSEGGSGLTYAQVAAAVMGGF